MPRSVVSILVDDLLAIEPVRNLFGVELQTPNLDRLAAMGVSFDNAFAAVALCSPARATLMTGQSPFMTGIHTNNDPISRIDLAETLPAEFRNAGYITANFGKNFGNLRPDAAVDIFDVFVDHKKEGDPTEEGQTGDSLNVRDAIDFLNDHSGSPSLVMVGLHDPHAPYESPPEYNIYNPHDIVLPDLTQDDLPPFIREYLQAGNLDDKSLRVKVADYFANVTEMDARLGELLDAIEALPGKKPIIMLASDHGHHAGGDHDIVGKFTLYDAAARMPLIIVDPDAPPELRGQHYQGVVSGLDFAPTMLSLAGIAVPDYMQGKSLAERFYDPTDTKDGEAITSMWGSLSVAVNIGGKQWRYTRYEDGSEELFDVSEDVFNVVNLANVPEFAVRKERLREALERELAKLGVEIDEENDIVSGNRGAGDSIYFVTETSDARSIHDEGGQDILYSTRSKLTIPEGIENVTVSGSQEDAANGFRIFGNGLDNVIIGGRSQSRDILMGNDGRDILEGARGDDLLMGGRGADTLYGGSDNSDDVLKGGAGDDRLEDDHGSDTFVIVFHRGDLDDVHGFDPANDVIRLIGEQWVNATVVIDENDAMIVATGHVVLLRNAAQYNLSMSDFEVIA